MIGKPNAFHEARDQIAVAQHFAVAEDMPAILPERFTEPINDFRALPCIFRESSPHAYETKISGVLWEGSSGRAGASLCSIVLTQEWAFWVKKLRRRLAEPTLSE